VVAAQPLQELESALAAFRQAGNAAFPTQRLLGRYAPRGGMATSPRAGALPTAVLQAARELQDFDHDGELVPWPDHPGVWLKALRLQNRPAPVTPADRPALQRELEKRFGSVLAPPAGR
jgi:hypothetical protein